MTFSEKLSELRRSRGWSQEQLGEKLGVTRQTISKWELGTTTPEMEKLAAMSDLFGITTDELIKGEAPQSRPLTEDKPASPVMRRPAIEYKSRRTLRGIPLVHINYGVGRRTAKGIIAIGNKAVGVVSIGFLSVGVVSCGLLSLGLLTLGCVCAGLFAFGSAAAGLFAFGAFAIGWQAFGGVAFGTYAIGGAAFATDIAFGGTAQAHIAIGDSVQGAVQICEAVPAEQAKSLIMQELPDTSGFVADFFSFLTQNMKH